MQVFKELVDDIFEISHSLRFVGVVDVVENTLYSKMAENKPSLLTQHEEEKFAVDLKHIKQLQKDFDTQLGKVIFSHVVRENIQQLVFRLDNIIIYATADPEVDNNTMVEISKLIKDTITHKFDKKLTIGTIQN